MARAKPMLDWLTEARNVLNADPAWRKLGSTDVKLGLHIGGEARLVTFQAFEVGRIEVIEAAELRDADIVIEMPVREWNAYLRSRARGKGASLLSLDLDAPGGIVRAATPVKKLMFERFNVSLQAFVDKGAELAAAAAA